MASHPRRPEAEEIDGETRRILDQRLRTFDEDGKGAWPTKEVLEEIRANFIRKPPVPR